MEIVRPFDMPNEVLEKLFLLEYGDSTTLDRLKEDAPKHLWIRFYLETLENGGENG